MKRTNTFFLGIIILAIAAMLSTGCSSNSKEVLNANDTTKPICDSLIVQYANTIKPILAANCNICHSTINSGSLGGGIILDNYISVFNWVDTTTGSNLGTLYQNVLSGRMPKNASKLSACEIGKISKWIRTGAKNN